MATTRRFFVENIGQTAVLTGDEFSHAKNVLRLREGDEVVLLDGSGREYDAVINETGKREMLCTVLSSRPSDKEPETRVKLLLEGAGFSDVRMRADGPMGGPERVYFTAIRGN